MAEHFKAVGEYSLYGWYINGTRPGIPTNKTVLCTLFTPSYLNLFFLP